jgi:hypothetical protein
MQQPSLMPDLKHTWMTIARPAYSDYYVVYDKPLAADVEPNTLAGFLTLQEALEFVKANFDR